MSKHSALNTFGRSGNPAFTRNFENAETFSQTERMTLDGAVNKTAILLALCFAGAFAGWNVPALMAPGAIIAQQVKWWMLDIGLLIKINAKNAIKSIK
jgi:uncharacterized YccA/Bax inhibitor family protein